MRFLTIIALLMVAPFAWCQCPGGQCPAPSQTSFAVRFAQAAPAVMSWLADPDGSGKHYLFSGRQHVGTLESGTYRRVNLSGEWPIETPPIAPPAETIPLKMPEKSPEKKVLGPAIFGETQEVSAEAEADPEVGPMPRKLPDELPEWQTQGVDLGRMREEEAGFTLNGFPISKRQAFEAMAGTLTDDRGKRFVVAVGDRAFGDEFKRLWKSVPDSTKDKVHCQVYGKDNYAVALCGYADGVSIQDAPDKEGKGKVISRFRQMPTAEQLIEAIRKADPSYKPDADPDPLKPAPVPAPSPAGPSAVPTSIPTNYVIGGVIVAGFVALLVWKGQAK
jgi:hypothetical protein